MEECYFEDVDQRGIDSSYEILKLLANAFENHLAESRENRACQRGATSDFVVGERPRGVELKPKFLEPGHSGQASDHGLG
jgi:hypothetical protein